jgi:hypothetical protein
MLRGSFRAFAFLLPQKNLFTFNTNSTDRKAWTIIHTEQGMRVKETTVTKLLVEISGQADTSFAIFNKDGVLISANENWHRGTGIYESSISDYVTGFCGLPKIDSIKANDRLMVCCSLLCKE